MTTRWRRIDDTLWRKSISFAEVSVRDTGAGWSFFVIGVVDGIVLRAKGWENKESMAKRKATRAGKMLCAMQAASVKQ